MPKITKTEAGYQYHPDTEYRCAECVMAKPLGKTPIEVTRESQAGCAWYGPSDSISPTKGSCNQFAHAHPDHGFYVPWFALFTKPQLGYLENKGGFSCKRCAEFVLANNDCRKVAKDSEGDTPGEISPGGCCNFWEPDRRRASLSTEDLNAMIALAQKGVERMSIDEYRRHRRNQG